MWLKARYDFREFARFAYQNSSEAILATERTQNGPRQRDTFELKKKNRTEGAVYSVARQVWRRKWMEPRAGWMEPWEGSETAARRGARSASRRPHASATRGEKRPQEAVQRGGGRKTQSAETHAHHWPTAKQSGRGPAPSTTPLGRREGFYVTAG